jgi:hypothetical protein
LKPAVFFTEFKKFITGEQWVYLPYITLGDIAVFVFILNKRDELLKRIKNNNMPAILLYGLIIWVLLFFVHVIFMPGKYGRFFVLAVLPMIMIFSSVFSDRANFIFLPWLKSICMFLFFLSVLYNLFLHYYLCIYLAQNTYSKAENKLHLIVGDNTLGIFPLHWILNGTLINLSIYTINRNDNEFLKYFSQYGWPHYIAIIDYQKKEIAEQMPYFFSKLIYITRIQDYYIYKVQ